MKTTTADLPRVGVAPGSSARGSRLRIATAATTWAFALLMAVSGVAYLAGAAPAVATMHDLGYPPYFLKLLGPAKVLGALALVGPRVPVLREWAYAGFTFDLIAAIVSHAAVGEPARLPLPIIMLGLLFTSYALRRLVAGRGV
jgi:hypothetical protein